MPLNPYVLAGAAAFYVGSVATAGWWMYGAGQNAEIAKQVEIQQAIDQTREAAQEGAAHAIAQIKIEHRTITQPIREQIRTRNVYRDCKHPDSVREQINAVIGHRAPAGSGQLPGLPD